jgi:hypothetical protein
MLQGVSRLLEANQTETLLAHPIYQASSDTVRLIRLDLRQQWRNLVMHIRAWRANIQSQYPLGHERLDLG